MNFFRFFLICEFFFLVLKKRLSHEIWIWFRKKTTYYTQKISGFVNTTQRFFDKRGFQKLERNLKKFICMRTNRQINFALKKVTLPVFLLNNFFSLIC